MVEIAYGDAAQQFGRLHLPEREGDTPLVVLIHGGFWRAPWDLELMTPLVQSLTDRGWGVWNVEYRRVGDEDGGFPGTLEDVAAAVDAVAGFADEYGIDTAEVAVVGHSAGGHLALWVAGRMSIAGGEVGARPEVTPVVAVGQAPVADLAGASTAGLGADAVTALLGVDPQADPDRLRAAQPIVGSPVVNVVGGRDDIVPPEFSEFPGAATVRIADADHFDLIDPDHEAWAAVLRVLEERLGGA